MVPACTVVPAATRKANIRAVVEAWSSGGVAPTGPDGGGPGPGQRRHVAIRTDCSPTMGVGHLLRSLAFAEELTGRGHRVTLLGSTNGMAWPDRQVRDRGLVMVPAGDADTDDADAGARALVDQLRHLEVDAVDLDGYQLPAELGRTARTAGIPVMTMVDGPYGLHQHADLYVDQNLGAEVATDLPAGAAMLAGPDHALLRDQVRDRRGRAPAAAVPDRPRVLVVFGGTDPYGGTVVVVDLLRSLGLPMTIVAVAGRDETAAALRALPLATGVELEVHGTVDDLPALAVGCDAAVSAAGTSVWELLCLGLPTGLVCVTDNQRVGYLVTEREDVVAAVGELDALRGGGPAVDRARALLTVLLTDPASRARWQDRGRVLVDGDGRVRVADALLRLADDPVD